MRLHQVGLCIPAAVVVASCAPAADSTLEANKEVVRQYIKAYNTEDFVRLDDLVLSDFRRHSKSTVEVNSLEELKEQLQQSAQAFPDGQIAVITMVAEADYVVTYATWSGTQEAPLGSFPASGLRAEIPFFFLFRLDGGRIAEFWTEWDNINLLTQLGHYPPASGT